jgi:hypothetical protein
MATVGIDGRSLNIEEGSGAFVKISVPIGEVNRVGDVEKLEG